MPQGSILGPVLFSIFINDIFLHIENSVLCNHENDSIVYASGESFSIIRENLKVDFFRISKWFHETFMILNPDECHFMVKGNSNCTCNFTCNTTTMECSKEEKVLGITIDHKLTSTPRLGTIIKKANQKLHVLSRVKCYIGFKQNKLIIPFFIKSQFSYCSLIWMFCSRTSMNKLNNIHKKCLRFIVNDYELSLNELLESSHKLSVYKTCINYIVIEVFKYLHGLPLELILTFYSSEKSIQHSQYSENPWSVHFGVNAIVQSVVT